MQERPAPRTDAVLVNPLLDSSGVESDQQEFRELACSAGAHPVASITGARRAPDPRYFVGSGKAEEIAAVVAETGAQIVLVNHALTPSQERNLERLVKCRVLDRTGLILDIFAQRAQTFEGKLQVELAQLRHMSTRLVRGWTHLERQKGGIGLRGPGETQIETDRRLIGHRIRVLGERLRHIQARRGQNRRARRRADCYTVSLVGYTNAGKSSLFNALTGDAAYAADRLFATLDPKLRRIEMPGAGPVVIVDTVGFIRALPHELVAAFRATLEETLEADLLVHVVDVGDPNRDEHCQQVRAVLESIGAGTVPVLEVWNKIDRIDTEPRCDRNADGVVVRAWVSARTGAGLDGLRAALSERVRVRAIRYQVHVPVAAPDERARLYRMGAVLSEQTLDEGGWLIDACLDPRQRALLSERVDLRPLEPAVNDAPIGYAQ
ncbi:MAG: GTPase HflX [Gammaproteobacteria bacterium]|nr:GTPase HflX [Gammaproteobacteria bacterium]